MTTDPAHLDTDAGRAVVRLERVLPHPIERVWHAVTDPAELAHWFPAKVGMTLTPGSEITFDDEHAGSYTGEVREVDAPRLFAFTWNGDLLRIELETDGTGTRLRFSHFTEDRPHTASFATGWTSCLGGLAAMLSGQQFATIGEFDPDGMQKYPEQHEQYVRRFGLDVAQVDGESVRLERLLPYPRDRAEPLLPADEDGVHYVITAEDPAGTRILATAQGDATRRAAAIRERLNTLIAS